MAHLWRLLDGYWRPEPLKGGALSSFAAGVRVMRVAGGSPRWVLLADPGAARVRVNGDALPGGLRVLAERDEIRLPSGERTFFSRERLAEVVSMPAGDRPVRCARCRQVIPPDSPAVRCPSPDCGVWHHASEKYPCWTYGPTCAACPTATSTDSGYRFCPEDL